MKKSWQRALLVLFIVALAYLIPKTSRISSLGAHDLPTEDAMAALKKTDPSTPAASDQGPSRDEERQAFLNDKMNRIQTREARNSNSVETPTITIRSGDTNYAPLPGYLALPKNAAPRAGLELVKNVGGYVIYKANEPRSPDERLARFDPEDPPILRNENSGQTGIANGLYNLSLVDTRQTAEIARDAGLLVEQVSEHIQRAFLRAPKGYDLAAGLRNLEQDPRVKSVELDIQTHLTTSR